jgi:hypothetical protein
MVSVPESLDQATRLKCPLCDRDFPPSELQTEDAAGEDPQTSPPSLVPVDALSEAPTAETLDGLSERFSGAEADPFAFLAQEKVGQTPGIQIETEDAEVMIEEVTDDATEGDTPEGPAEEAPDEGTDMFAFLNQEEVSEADEIQMETGDEDIMIEDVTDDAAEGETLEGPAEEVPDNGADAFASLKREEVSETDELQMETDDEEIMIEDVTDDVGEGGTPEGPAEEVQEHGADAFGFLGQEEVGETVEVAGEMGDEDRMTEELADEEAGGERLGGPAEEVSEDGTDGFPFPGQDAVGETPEIGPGTGEAEVADAAIMEHVSGVFDETDAARDETEVAEDEGEPQEVLSEEEADDLAGGAEEDNDPLVRSPHDETEFRLSELIITATGEPLGETAAAVIAKNLLSGAAGEEAGAGLGFLEQVQERPAFDFAVGATAEGATAPGTFHFGEAAVGAEGRTTPASVTARPVRKRKQKSILRELIGVVLGGVAGLVLAYYGLNYFGGKPRFNFLKIYLPGVEHTAKYRPDWWPWGQSEDIAEMAAEELEAPGMPGEVPQASRAPEKASTGASDVSSSEPFGGTTPARQPKSEQLEMPEMTPEELPDVGGGLELPPAEVTVGMPGLGLSAEPGAEDEPADAPPTMAEPGLPPADIAVGLPEGMLSEQEPADSMPAEAPLPEPTPDLPPATVGVGVPDIPAQPDLKVAAEPPAPSAPGADLPSANRPEAAAAERTVTAGYPSLANPPTFTAEQLDSALQAAQESIALSPDAAGANGGSPGLVTPDTYQAVCELGEILAFAQDAGGEPESNGPRAAVHDFIRALGQSKDNVRAIAQLTPDHLENSQRKSGGILFAGKVEEVLPGQEDYRATIKLASVETRITLISREPLDLEPQDSLIGLGSLVSEPGGPGADSPESAAGHSHLVWCAAVVKF